MDKLPLGTRVKTVMAMLSVSQRDLAQMGGFAQPLLSIALNGHNSIDSMLPAIQAGLGVDFSRPITIHPDGRVEYTEYASQAELLEAA
ncbi:MAG: helix-turn-helix transcriptional regulator [Anaerolineae bacterium]|nr:helix-turn-helix transcriptional regulator [Anaerolineae bacterium]